MGLTEFELQVVQRMPEELESGILYISFECNVVVHLCACGCREKVALPIHPDFWTVTYTGETVSLTPSIGNFQFPCKSHYWVKGNKVVWADDFAPKIFPPTAKSKTKRRFLDRLKALFDRASPMHR